MKKHQGISWILSVFLSVGMAFPQTGEKLVDTVVQDDLGVVSDAFQENFFEALKYKAIENHEKAIEALERCLELDADEPAIYLELGKNHNYLSKHSKAAAYLENARKMLPEHETVLTELYKAYFMDQRFGKALPVVVRLTEIDFDYSEDLANLYFLNQDYNKALEVIDRLDEVKGNNDFRNGLRRQIYTMTDDADATIADLEDSIEIDPKEEQHYLNLIFVYNQVGDTEMALATAKRLLNVKPSSERAHLVLYKLYLEENNGAKAIESMKVLLKGTEVEEEIKYQVLHDLLLFAAANPELEEHLMDIVEMLATEQSNGRVYEELGDFYVEQEDFNKALTYFEQGLIDGISNFGLMLKALLLQIELEKHEEALQLTRRGLERFPSQPVLYLIQGTALNQKEAFHRAASQLEEGLEYIIDDVDLEVAFYEQVVVA